jgi:hypothetical protein
MQITKLSLATSLASRIHHQHTYQHTTVDYQRFAIRQVKFKFTGVKPYTARPTPSGS